MFESVCLSLLVCVSLFLALSVRSSVYVSMCSWAAVCVTVSPHVSVFPCVSGSVCPWVAVLVCSGGKKDPKMLVHPAPPWAGPVIERIREK